MSVTTQQPLTAMKIKLMSRCILLVAAIALCFSTACSETATDEKVAAPDIAGSRLMKPERQYGGYAYV